MRRVNETSSAGSVIGVQLPLGVKQRKSKLDEVIRLNEDIHEGHVLSYLVSLGENTSALEEALDAARYDEVATAIREHLIREVVKNKIKHVVRRRPGGGYAIYKNAPGNDPAKPRGNYPNKASAKKALAQQETDPDRKARLQKQARMLAKHPEKNVGKPLPKKKPKPPKTAHLPKKPKPGKPQVKKEELELLRAAISALIKESLFREQQVGSPWDDHLMAIPPEALAQDSKFQSLQKKIDKATETVLNDALNTIKKEVRQFAKVEGDGLQKTDDGRTYLPFRAKLGNIVVDSIYIYAEAGIPRVELSPQAEKLLADTERPIEDAFRGRLASLQEKVFAKYSQLSDAIAARDAYLAKKQQEATAYLQKLTPLELTLLKGVISKQFRRR